MATKKIGKLIIFVFLFISILVAPATNACTIFTASYGQKVLFAGNEDQSPNSSFLVVDKRGTLGVVYFATPWKEYPLVMQAGINEKGLSFDYNWIPREKLNPHPERKKMTLDWVNQLLKECSSVDEVLSKVSIYSSTYNFGKYTESQVHFADKNGDAIVIHPGKDGEITYTRKLKGNSHLVSSNFNLGRLNQENLFAIGLDRYKRADEMLSKIRSENDLTVEYIASILEATHQEVEGVVETLYSTIFDLQNLRVYWYYNHQFDTPHVLDVKDELTKTTEYRQVLLKDLISNK